MSGKKRAFWTAAICMLGGAAFLSVATILPRTTTTVYASPDETAVAMFARGPFFTSLSIHGGIPEALSEIPGLHPRSMVQQGGFLVPVGFLGMPMLAWPFERGREGSSAFLTALLVLSCAWPLFWLARRCGRVASWTSVAVFLSFPTVLLYANRGLFPNLPVVALALWGIWALHERDDRPFGILAGTVIGVALLIRPVEAAWLLPWALWAGWGSWRVRWASILIPAGAVCLFGYIASVMTYGSWVPTTGYWLRDTVSEPLPVMTDDAGAMMHPSSVLPFGIHPRAAWENVRLFWLGLFGAWVGAAFVGIAAWVRNRRGPIWTVGRIAPLILTGWTICVLLLFYGQSLYADNINGTVSVGNSFLRYLLPLVPLVAIGIGLLAQALWEQKRGWRVLTVAIIALFAVYGTAVALLRPEEGILKTRAELTRYQEIRAIAVRMLPRETLVLSERSDKVFAGSHLIAVSPIPKSDTLQALLERGASVALFHRNLTRAQEETFADGVFLDRLEPIATFNNEVLYRVLPP